MAGAADGTVHFHRCTGCSSAEELLELARQRDVRQLSPAERERFLHDG